MPLDFNLASAKLSLNKRKKKEMSTFARVEDEVSRAMCLSASRALDVKPGNPSKLEEEFATLSPAIPRKNSLHWFREMLRVRLSQC